LNTPHSRWKGILIYIAALAATILLIIAFLVSAIWWFPPLLVKNRQHNVEPALNRWGQQYSQIADDHAAATSASMLLYIQVYYPPGYEPGMEPLQAAVEKTRSESIRKITTALAKYSGTNFGTNAYAWQSWASNRVAQTNVR
jgi:hypothetical protein